MENPKVSVIIPAHNEEQFIKRTIESVRGSEYKNLEIIVVVNGSTDRTYEIAKSLVDKALSFAQSLGPSGARIEGVKVATGDIFLFLDADTLFSLKVVGEVARAGSQNIIGTCLAKAEKWEIRSWLFFSAKNWMHRIKIIKSVIDGVIFCSKDLYFKAGGFNPNEKVAEFHNLIRKARKAGGRYKCLTSCYAIVSVRRYEKKGYLRIIFYWIGWGIAWLFKTDKKKADEYWQENKK